jgi:hypothetical protein
VFEHDGRQLRHEIRTPYGVALIGVRFTHPDRRIDEV